MLCLVAVPFSRHFILASPVFSTTFYTPLFFHLLPLHFGSVHMQPRSQAATPAGVCRGCHTRLRPLSPFTKSRAAMARLPGACSSSTCLREAAGQGWMAGQQAVVSGSNADSAVAKHVA